MRRHTLAAMILVPAVLTGGVFFLKPGALPRTTSAAETIDVSKSKKPGLSSALQPVERNIVGVAQARETELEKLDCQAPEGDVLRIDDETISAESFCAELEVLAGSPPDRPTPAWSKQAHQLKERLIHEELVRSALAEEDVTIALDSPGDHLQRQVRARREWQKLLELRGFTRVTEGELRLAYDRNPGRYGTPARATVQGYALRLSPVASDDEIAKARQIVKQFQEAAQSGDAVIAAKRSGLVALAAFDVEEGGLESDLAQAALTLPMGRWSEPVRTKIGWLVVQVTKVHPAAVVPFDEVHDKVEAMVTAQHRRDAEASLKRELREGADVEELAQF